MGECAVKRLEEGSMQGQREFLQEVQVLIQKPFEEGSYLRLVDSCITQLKAQGPSGPVTRVKKKKKHSEFF